MVNCYIHKQTRLTKDGCKWCELQHYRIMNELISMNIHMGKMINVSKGGTYS